MVNSSAWRDIVLDLTYNMSEETLSHYRETLTSLIRIEKALDTDEQLTLTPRDIHLIRDRVEKRLRKNAGERQ